MIAANDPQEYIPGGRQQAHRHPDPPELEFLSAPLEVGDDFLLHRLERVKLDENAASSEWWTLRKPVERRKSEATSINAPANDQNRRSARDSAKSFLSGSKSRSDLRFDDSWSPQSLDASKKRISDIAGSRLFVPGASKRFSNELERSDARGSGGLRTPNAASSAAAKCSIKLRSPEDSMEEELYVRGNLVVWSRGLSYNDEERARAVICCYSSCLPLKHAVWCTFRPEDADLLAAGGGEAPMDEPLDCLCIADAQNLRVYTKDDESFIATLPFQVHKMWPSTFGIFIEREDAGAGCADAAKEALPALYSLSHPLDIAAPVAYAKSGAVKIIQSECFQVVFTSESLDVCMLYDAEMHEHLICRVRRTKGDELDALNKTGAVPSMTTRNCTAGYSLMDSYRSVFPIASPFGSRPGSVASSAPPASRGPSLSPAGPFHTSSRCHTPAPAPSPGGKATPGSQMQRLSRLLSTVRSCDASVANRFPNADCTSPAVVVEPAFCLEHVWCETLQDGSVNSPATSVFLTEDLLGRAYLCFVVATRALLSMVKLDYSNNSDDIVFGKATCLPARDAVGVPHLRMLALLEHSSNVVLYSGRTVIGKLHIGGALAQHAPSPYAVRTHSTKFFNSPFPRRSSLLPTSAPADPRFDEHLLSPVLPAAPAAQRAAIMQIPEIGERARVVLTGLKDAVDNRITLQYSDGSCYRVALPNMAYGALIEDCLNALRVALPRDLVMATLSRWYARRNLPGNASMSLEEEWLAFSALLYDLLGYNAPAGASRGARGGEHTPCAAQVKRQRPSAEGNVTDWNALRAHAALPLVDRYLQFAARAPPCAARKKCGYDALAHVNASAALFSHVRVVHYVLHLVYEELKLNTLRKADLPRLAPFLAQLAADLGLEAYTMHYWRDFPAAVGVFDPKRATLDVHHAAKWPHIPDPGAAGVTSIMDYVRWLTTVGSRPAGREGEATEGYPVINSVNTRSQQVVRLLATYLAGDPQHDGARDVVDVERFLRVITPPGCRAQSDADARRAKGATAAGTRGATRETPAQRLVLTLVELEMAARELETLPLAVSFILYDALWRCRQQPPADWPAAAYALLQRPDLAAQSAITRAAAAARASGDMCGEAPARSKPRAGGVSDGMEDVDSEVLKLRFAADQRVLEARSLLQSSRPAAVHVVQRPDVSDHDHLEEQEKQLYAICTRTMALPVGRGMLTLHTATPVITEPLAVPPLCLAGKAHPRGTTVELTHIDTPANMAHWPQFHNGVANGLRISPSARHVDSTWIVFNKPKANAETMMEHAGFLMALGLNGHLRSLAILNRFDYLAKFHEMTSVGVLLGLGAAFRGTSNSAVTKMLSVHVEGLLPPTSIELDVPQNLQVASLLSVGLIYQGTAHRRMIEVMLAEIGRPPGPEMDNSVDRQAYALAAGLALGLVALRQGGQAVGLSDLKVPDALHYYMVGGSRRPLTGAQREKYRVPSFQIREGSAVNLDVTAPGATLALGLMYLGTGDRAIAGWMAPPDTHYLLDFVRPDFLMLRTLCRALILWHEVEPEKAWVQAQVPDSIRQHCMVEPNLSLDLDYEAMHQAYCNIVAGACFAIGLKFAGSGDEDVCELLLEYCLMFACLKSKTIGDLAGKPTMETCLNVVLISVAMVMAGTGNLEVIRIVRYLRRRVGLASSAVVTYGSHLAVHMALGLLFLGGGRYTLSSSPASVAALICAFYPKFPTHSNDNRYHLQAFRHLYVLAAEPRLLMPADIVTGRMCYAWLNVVRLDGRSVSVRAPALIPDPDTLRRVSVHDQRYWPVVFERERNWDQLTRVLASSGRIDVKQRAGCLSYAEDKTGFRSELARTLTESDVVPWNPPAKSIIAFSSDTIVRLFADQFLGARGAAPTGRRQEGSRAATPESALQQTLTQITYESVVQDKLAALPLLIQLIEIVADLDCNSTALDIQQVKIVHSFVLRGRHGSVLVDTAFPIALHQKALSAMDAREPALWDALKAYVLRKDLGGCEIGHKLAQYAAFYDIPYGLQADGDDVLALITKLRRRHACDAEAIDKVLRILGYVR